MEQTFMTIHNLTPEATILFASESIIDILGYHPQEVQGKSCFDYFHPEEVPFARSVHSRGVLLDKAAVLHYARILASDGRWVSCECCFTIVHDVLVACTSIYKRGEKSERRAIEAPQIRRLFSSSPRDPRYHMLEHLSPKFKMPPMEREPRAALILNRFTRTLTVMFATNAVANILGVRPDQIKDKSFYECIQENCLQDAIKCLESAKANDSIAYLRFWYRDPRREEDFDDEEEEDEDDEMAQSSEDSDGGGVELTTSMDIDGSEKGKRLTEINGEDVVMDGGISAASASTGPFTSGPSSSRARPASSQSSVSRGTPGRRRREPILSFELEAVVSCTSDGLVVVLRKARPPIPALHPPMLPAPFDFENGLFAAPWGQQPIRPYYPPEMLYTFRPPLLPQFMPLRENVKAAGGPPMEQLMKSIRDVAVFAWALVGINGNFAAYGHGLPRGEAQPDDLPAWETKTGQGSDEYLKPEGQAAQHWSTGSSTGSDQSKTAVSAAAPYLWPILPEPPAQSCPPGQQEQIDNHPYGQLLPWPRQLTPQSRLQPAAFSSVGRELPVPPTNAEANPTAHLYTSQAGSGRSGLAQDPWSSQAPTYRTVQGGFVMPTSQEGQAQDPSRSLRFMWQ